MAAQTDFISACKTGDVEAVARILGKEAVGDDQLQKGLSKAAWRGHPAVAERLLSKGAKVGRMTFLGSTNRGDSTMFELFVKYGFYINSTEFDEGTALRMSVGEEDLMRWLLTHGADPNVAHDRAPSALISAVVDEEGGECVRILLEHGAVLEPNILHHVIESSAAMSDRTCRDRVEQLVRAGANINHIDPKRKGTPLHCATWHNRGDIVEALIELGADPNLTFEGRTAADLAKESAKELKPYFEIYDFLKDKTKITPEKETDRRE